jgi:hypothetical protein
VVAEVDMMLVEVEVLEVIEILIAQNHLVVVLVQNLDLPL